MLIYFGICSIYNDIKRSPESLEHTRKNYSMIKVVEVPNKVFIEIITGILECVISSFVSKSSDKIKRVCSLLKLLSSKHKWKSFLGRHIPFFTWMGIKISKHNFLDFVCTPLLQFLKANSYVIYPSNCSWNIWW